MNKAYHKIKRAKYDDHIAKCNIDLIRPVLEIVWWETNWRIERDLNND